MTPTSVTARRYGAAILLSASALALTLAFEAAIQPTIFLLFFPAVAVSGWYGGRGPAVVTGLLSILAANFFLIPPTHSLGVAQPGALIRLGIFLLVALLIGSLTESLRTLRKQEADRAARLEHLAQERTRLYEAERAARHRVELLAHAGRVFSGAAGMDRTLATIVQEVVDATGARVAAVHAPQEEGGALRLLQHTGLSDSRGARYATISAADVGPVREAAATRTPVYVDSAESWRARFGSPPTREGAPMDEGAWVALPLISDEALHGVLALGFDRSRTFSREERSFLQALGVQCAQPLVRAGAHEALLQSEARFRATFQNAAVGIAHVGLDGHWLRLNDRLCEILGYLRERLVELSWQDITHPEDLHTDEENAARLLAGDIDSYRLEKRYLRGDGSLVWAQLTGSVVRRDDGEPEYFIAVVEDISARKEAERQARERQAALEEANQSKSAFMATMSHELRTPLNAVIGYADLLTQGVPEPIGKGAQQQVHRIRVAARHLLQLIEEVLTFSRLEAGRERVNAEEIEIPRLIEEIRAVAEPLAEGAGLALAIEAHADVATFRTDPRKLRQVLLNLVGNAIKFTERGEVRLAVEHRGSELRFVVSDTGMGISEADFDRLFDPFWQADGSTTRKAHGSGLGLTISRRFAQLLGGTLEVASKVDAGSTFTLRLPLAPPTPEAGPGVAETTPR